MLVEKPLDLILIANDPALAEEACAAGINRIMIDLEVLGKRERQYGRNTFITHHQPEDVSRIRKCVPKGGLMVRIDPIHPGSPGQVDEVIQRGADYVMLPMFRTAQEAATFVRLVNGHAKTMLLLETREARDHIGDILQLPGIEEIHVGLNDLSLALGMSFLFQPLTEGIVDELAARIRGAGIRFGFGGVGCMDGGPLPGELVIAEHKRVGSEMVILSRAFYGYCKTFAELRLKGIDLRENVNKLRAVEQRAARRHLQQVERDRRSVQRIVRAIARQLTCEPA